MFKNCSSNNNLEGKKKNQNLELLSLLLFSITQDIIAKLQARKEMKGMHIGIKCLYSYMT